MPILSTYEPSFDSNSRDFKTHLNYIKCLDNLFNNLALNININRVEPLDRNQLSKFERLQGITKISIDGEVSSCDREIAYSQVVAPWLPVKCYYMLYYLESIFIYLLDASPVGFGPGGHTRIPRALKNAISTGNISFTGPSSASFQEISKWETVNSFSTDSGSNLSPHYYTTPSCVNSLRKKMADYIEYDWKTKEKISNYRTNSARLAKQTRLLPKEFTLLDYFYWMRIKANYRDIDFLDFDNVNEVDAYEYIKNYVSASKKYANILLLSIDKLKMDRGMV